MTTYFKVLRDEAKPVPILKKAMTTEELERSVQQELGVQQTGGVKK